MQPKPTSGVPKFLFVFVAVGIVLEALGVKELITKDVHAALPMLLSGAMFTFIPLVISIQLKKQQAQVDVAAQKRREDPAPWLRRADWAKREIAAKEIAPPFVFFIAAAVAVGFGFFGAGSFSRGHRDSLFSWLPVLFTVIPAIIMVALGCRSVARRKKFGKSIFKLRSATGVIGGKLEGNIQGESQIELPGDFKVQLACYQQTGGGDNSKVKKLWDASQPVRVPGGTGLFMIPVSIAIPATCEESSDADPSNLIFWRLEATAKVPGVNFLARFEVPVFRVNNNERDSLTRHQPVTQP